VLGFELPEPTKVTEGVFTYDVDSISHKTNDSIMDFPTTLPTDDWTLRLFANTPGRISVCTFFSYTKSNTNICDFFLVFFYYRNLYHGN